MKKILFIYIFIHASISSISQIYFPYTPPSHGAILGNSTIAGYGIYIPVSDLIITNCLETEGNSCALLAVPQHTIDLQKQVWLNDPNKYTYNWIVIAVGINDIPMPETATVALARYQDLVNVIIQTKHPSAKIIACAITPFKGWLDANYPAPTALFYYQKWLEFNMSISGSGANPITGVNYRLTTNSHLLNDGYGNLKAIYDTGDHIHDNNLGRQVVATEITRALNYFGFLGCKERIGKNKIFF